MFEVALRRVLRKLRRLPAYILAVPIALVIRLIKPFLLVRFSSLHSSRIGHLAGNIELYLCRRDAGINVPKQFHIDVFIPEELICNRQLVTMWKRTIHIWPNWLLEPVVRVMRLMPGASMHCADPRSSAMDSENLLDRFPPHLQFSQKEQLIGAAGLNRLGIPPGAKFICMIVRDDAYLADHLIGDHSYHDYRNSSISNYVLAAEMLADKGFYVLRMGSRVREKLPSCHPRVIDYATNGMRTDFMDIYLGACCAFCISTGTGWDAVPEMFRRPIVYVNYVPLGFLHTFSTNYISISKHHVLSGTQRPLTFQEIFDYGVGYSSHSESFKQLDIQLIENTPEEIRDVCLEMCGRLDGTWITRKEDHSLQSRFWKCFQKEHLYIGHPLHGELRGRFGASFLRNNERLLPAE